MLDRHVGRVEDVLNRPPNEAPILVYWLEHDLSRGCEQGLAGCYYPGTRILFARAPTIRHELVHAVLDSLGKAYFIEEGLAEMLSGRDVFHIPKKSDPPPSKSMTLSARAYRKGGLDYAAAAHFARWVRDTGGSEVMTSLGGDIHRGDGGGRIEGVLEDKLDAGMEELEVRYREDAPHYYAGLWHQDVPELDPAMLSGDLEHRLDCNASDTFGPLPDGSEGMYQVESVRIDRRVDLRVVLHGDPGTSVDIFRPYLGRAWQPTIDWAIPDPSIDADGIHLEPEEPKSISLHPGTYVVVFWSTGTEPTSPSLELVRTDPERPATRLPHP